MLSVAIIIVHYFQYRPTLATTVASGFNLKASFVKKHHLSFIIS